MALVALLDEANALRSLDERDACALCHLPDPLLRRTEPAAPERIRDEDHRDAAPFGLLRHPADVERRYAGLLLRRQRVAPLAGEHVVLLETATAVDAGTLGIPVDLAHEGRL